MSKVLLVNDCRFESMIMKDILDSLGYDVEVANEFEAISKVRFSYPEIVIANLVMKSIQGDELIEKIKGIRKEIKCILSSNNPIILKDYKNKKVDAVIHTPINKEELINALEAKLEIEIKEDIKYKFCPYCGGKLQGSFTFCPSCGHKLE